MSERDVALVHHCLQYSDLSASDIHAVVPHMDMQILVRMCLEFLTKEAAEAMKTPLCNSMSRPISTPLLSVATAFTVTPCTSSTLLRHAEPRISPQKRKKNDLIEEDHSA